MTIILLILLLALIILIIILLIKLSSRNNEKMEKYFRDMSFKLEEDMQESICRLKQELESDIHQISKDDDQ